MTFWPLSEIWQAEKDNDINAGGVAERFKAPVLKKSSDCAARGSARTQVKESAPFMIAAISQEAARAPGGGEFGAKFGAKKSPARGRAFKRQGGPGYSAATGISWSSKPMPASSFGMA